jgi:hypothetical protein
MAASGCDSYGRVDGFFRLIFKAFSASRRHRICAECYHFNSFIGSLTFASRHTPPARLPRDVPEKAEAFLREAL